WAQIVAVPPAANRGEAAAKAQTVTTFIAPADAPKYAINLPSPSSEQQGQMQKRAQAAPALTTKRQVRPIGFSRRLSNGESSLTLAGLPWQSLADGGKVAQVVVNSPGAAALRLGVVMSSKEPGVTLRFAGSAAAQVYGPYPAAKIAETKTYWSPVLEGESATLEIYVPPGIAPESVELR